MNTKVSLVIVALVVAAGAGGWLGFAMGRSYQDAVDQTAASIHIPDPANPRQMIPLLLLQYRNRH